MRRLDFGKRLLLDTLVGRILVSVGAPVPGVDPLLLTSHKIGICVQYTDGVYTLAGITFDKGQIVAWMPVADEHKLSDGTKHDPHATYHSDGKFQLRSYPNAHRLAHSIRFPIEQDRQPINSTFTESENLIVWGFNREDAKSRGYQGTGFDECVVVDADAIQPTQVETLVDDLGEFTSLVGVGATLSDEVTLGDPSHPSVAIAEPVAVGSVG